MNGFIIYQKSIGNGEITFENTESHRTYSQHELNQTNRVQHIVLWYQN